MILDIKALPSEYRKSKYENLHEDLRRVIYALQTNATHVLGEIVYGLSKHNSLIMSVQRKPDMSGGDRWVNFMINRKKNQIIVYFSPDRPLHVGNDDTGAFAISEKFLAGTFPGTSRPHNSRSKIETYNTYVPRITVTAS